MRLLGSLGFRCSFDKKDSHDTSVLYESFQEMARLSYLSFYILVHSKGTHALSAIGHPRFIARYSLRSTRHANECSFVVVGTGSGNRVIPRYSQYILPQLSLLVSHSINGAKSSSVY